ncbi:hypothetical protein EX30DRAFT_334427 [Ascodesmis nigricans]|uniref:Uncharacterized protein n=1 Tax=Ascodesmis nigricans TaxID=341454 RepID=A0A4S2MN03_9PEZI|nr:hypothetical protein EX30DRAFT_334427 [Ascodesmis nigricans]
MASLPPVPVYPGKGLGIIPLGSSLHHILNLLKQHPSHFTSISAVYDPSSPVTLPILILLDNNGLRLRFDGPDQRLRLIEIIDFTKCRPTYQSGDLTHQPASTHNPGTSNPTFKNIYHKLFGPTFSGKYLASESLYVLSYPGVSFSLPVDRKSWREDVDFVSQLTSGTITSMAIYSGRSWSDVCDDLFSRPMNAPRVPTNTLAAARASSANDEVELVIIRDNGVIELSRRCNPPLIITLHATTPQDIVTELGLPSSIYRKSDQRLNIHRAGVASLPEREESEPDNPPSEDDDERVESDDSGDGDFFLNYFNQGFDILISAQRSAYHPVVTKLIIHGNVPGSHVFQRYRRCRWIVDLPEVQRSGSSDTTPGSGDNVSPLQINSEESFVEMKKKLRKRFGEVGKPMPYSRGNDSPSSSCELLGGWEDGGGSATFGNTELYGFSGMVFEVLKNKGSSVTGLTVF